MAAYTEEQARTKWCPQATMTAKDSDAVGNREPGDAPLLMCIASECMMWRWTRASSISCMSTADKMVRREDGVIEFWPARPQEPGNWIESRFYDERGNLKPKRHDGITEWYRNNYYEGFFGGATGYCGLAGGLRDEK